MNDTLTSNEWAQRAFGQGQSSPNFSKRFQEMLDHCGFPKGRSRAAAVIEFFDKTRSVIYRCLSDDQCPKDIINMIERLFNSKKMPSGIDQRDVANWLITGEQNPFKVRDSRFIVNQKHSEQMMRVIAAVNNEAEKGLIDLSSLSGKQVISIYHAILKDMIKRDSLKPSSKLIKKLITI